MEALLPALILSLALLLPAQAPVPLTVRTVPTFTGAFVTAGKHYSYTFAGRPPESGGTTTIPTVLIPLSLSFNRANAISAVADLPGILRSPIFEPFPFKTGTTQYADAVQRAQFPQTAARTNWHTLLGTPQVAPPLQIDIPPGNGYVLHSQSTGKSLAIVDLDFVQQQLFQHLPAAASPDSLVIAVTENVAFYSLGDATVCCSLGTHGASLDPARKAAQAFVIASYLQSGVMPYYAGIQGLTQQIAEWFNDPLRGYIANEFPAWLKPSSTFVCGGSGESSDYLLEQPTDLLLSANATTVSAHGRTYQLENMALLPWFAQSPSPDAGPFSFPDTQALKTSAQPCLADAPHRETSKVPVVPAGVSKRHALIGYWEGYSSAASTALRDVSPQWDIVIATFAAPVKGSTSLLHFEPPAPFSDDRFKADVAYLQSKGKKVLISLGGGGQVVTLSTAEDLRNFVTSVSTIVEKYRFDGVDLDIETPSLLLDPGDTDFRKPTTPSIRNLIAAVHQLRQRFGPKFMLSEVPEAAQTQAGMQTYGGQFGSFLPVIYGTRDILSFVDAQDYNTPPLEALDGNYYFPGSADYHVALSEMLLHGFPIAGDRAQFFPAIPAEKIAIGLPATPASARNYTSVPEVMNALRYLIAGQPYPGAHYKLRRPSGYPNFLGAMFWAINEDRRNDYAMSNTIGPLLHKLPQ